MPEGRAAGEWGELVPVSYTRRDVLLYATGIGCGQGGKARYNDDLRYTYENDSRFAAFPTFPGVISFGARPAPKKAGGQAAAIPKSRGVKVGVDYERYMLKVKEVPPNGAKLFSRSRLYGVHQRKRGVITENEREICGEDGTVYYKIISGGFGIGGKLDGADVGLTESHNITPPSRAPDRVDELEVLPTQALVYRLSGDYNPLHIDPASPRVKAGGFPEPILHGACTLGMAARSVLRAYGANDPARFKAYKVRFASPVLPGQTLVTQMWDAGAGRIVFVSKVKETGKTVVGNSYMQIDLDAPLTRAVDNPRARM